MKNKNVDTAVILAAGRGERISNTAGFVAKPLIKIFDASLIERSIKNLINGFATNSLVLEILSPFPAAKITAVSIF